MSKAKEEKAPVTGAKTESKETTQGTILLRGLKRREVMALRAKAINFGGQVPFEKLEEVSKEVLAILLPAEFMADKFSELYEHEIWDLYRTMEKLTYPGEGQEKN